MDTINCFKCDEGDLFAILQMIITHLSSLQMSDVKRLPERIDCMLFRARFQEELDELNPVGGLN